MGKLKNAIKTIVSIAVCFLFGANVAGANGKILFLPQDNRPVSYQAAVEVIEGAGFKAIAPSENILSRGPETPGDTDALWEWLFLNAKDVNAAVLATDALLYGGLIPSRRHEISETELKKRLRNFSKLAKENPKLKIYLFTSLMRTPVDGAHAGNEELPYYQTYGEFIFKYTRLLDKEELEGLTEAEKAEKEELKQKIPEDIWADFMGRREKNFGATISLLKLVKDGKVKLMVLGRDDNAPLSATHLENRRIMKKAEELKLPEKSFYSLAGIDEFNTLLLARAANDILKRKPKVYVEYAMGVGEKTEPMYSDAPIGESVEKEIEIAGGKITKDIKGADVVFMVNTDILGRTGDASEWNPKYTELPNDSFTRDGAEEFFSQVKKYVDMGYPVSVADIAFVNGADNFFMRNLRDNDMFFKLNSYAGWNTATNSAGSSLAMGMLAKITPEDKKNRILLRRYLDDWAYQANIRTYMYNKAYAEGDNVVLYLNDAKTPFEEETTKRMRDFAKKQRLTEKNFKVTFPWNRLFECKLEF